MRLRGKSVDGTWSTLYTWSISTTIGVQRKLAWYRPTQSTVVTAIQILPCFSYTGYSGGATFGDVCAILIDADATYPSAGFYTDLPKNNLVSQINLSPSGVQIRGEKVDIWGVTTIHNTDGTGSTVLTGSTIRSAQIETGTLRGTNASLTFDMSTSSTEYKVEMKPGSISYVGETVYGIKFDDVNDNGAFIVDVKNVFIACNSSLSLE